MDMAGSTVSVVKGAVKYVGRGLAVFALEVKMTGQLLTGQDITKNYDFCHIGGATVQNYLTLRGESRSRGRRCWIRCRRCRRRVLGRRTRCR